MVAAVRAATWHDLVDFGSGRARLPDPWLGFDKEFDMIHRWRIAIVAVGIAGSAIMPLARAQHPDPNSPRYKGVVALSEFLTSKGDVALKEFVADRVSRQLRDSMNHERLTDALDQLRSGFTGARRSGARPEGPFAAWLSVHQ